MRTWSFSSAGTLFFGRHAVRHHLRDACERLGARRAFVVTDAILVKAGLLAQVAEPLSQSGVTLEAFERVTPEPGVELVQECIAAARAFSPDVVIGLGGGSNMDTAKLVSMILAHGGDPLDYTGDCRVPGPVKPLICIPTTAGTGSEVSAAAVFTDTANHIKVSCLSPYLRPAFAIVDPLFTVTCPPKVTADSGIDALTHAIEAYSAVDNDEFPLPSGEKSVYQGKNPLADAMAGEAIHLVGKFLRRAVKDGNDLEARDGMALAATLGGLAFSNAGVALVHAMEYPVGGAVHVSHGAGNGLLLPFVMRFNLPNRVDAYSSVAILLSDGSLGKEAPRETNEASANRAIAMVEALRSDIGIPTRLRDIGVTEDMLPGFAAKAFAIKRLMRVNPRMPQNEGEILEIYRAAFQAAGMSLRTFGTVLACLALAAWFWSRGERFIAANGPTFDEPAHLAAGYGYWTAGAFKLNPEHPPLLKLLWSFPLLFTDAPSYPKSIAETTKLNHWKVGSLWLFESGLPPRALLDPARRVNLALGSVLVLLVGWVCFRVWRSHLAAVAGCAFAAAEPTLLALSCILSTDLGVTLFGFLTCYLLWEYSAAPSRGLMIGGGISLGLLLGSKFSAVGIVAGLGAAGAIFVLRGGSLAMPGKSEARGFGSALELALRIAVIAIVTVAATYAFVHFPEWAKGLRFQLTRGAHGDGVMYLNGDVARRGWFHYFLVALALKLPLGLLFTAGAAAAWRLTRARPALRSAFLCLPPLIFFALASYSRVDIGVRVILPVLPFLFMLAAGLAAPGCCRVARSCLLTLGLAWCVYAAERSSPHDIAYFNEIAGGPVGGARHLADSNLDWGQGLPQLKEWMNREGVEVVYLAYFGTDHPEAHGLRFQALPGYGRAGSPGGELIPADAPRHVVVVSANLLLGMFLNEPDAYSWLRDRASTTVLGGSLYVFDLTGDRPAVERVRALAPR